MFYEAKPQFGQIRDLARLSVVPSGTAATAQRRCGSKSDPPGRGSILGRGPLRRRVPMVLFVLVSSLTFSVGCGIDSDNPTHSGASRSVVSSSSRDIGGDAPPSSDKSVPNSGGGNVV